MTLDTNLGLIFLVGIFESQVQGVLILGSILGARRGSINDRKDKLVNSTLQSADNGSNGPSESSSQVQEAVLANEVIQQLLVDLNELYMVYYQLSWFL